MTKRERHKVAVETGKIGGSKCGPTKRRTKEQCRRAAYCRCARRVLAARDIAFTMMSPQDMANYWLEVRKASQAKDLRK